MRSSKFDRALAAVVAAGLFAACSSDVTAPSSDDSATQRVDGMIADADARPADACMNVSATASGTLGPWAFNGVGGFGAQPLTLSLGGIDGTMASAVDYEVISGSKGQGAHHIFLSHYFWADDGVSWFSTEDQASCAPADHDIVTCLVNDHMRIVEGAGIFANATGRIHNHGWLDFTSPGPGAVGTIDLRIKGRVCGDGIG